MERGYYAQAEEGNFVVLRDHDGKELARSTRPADSGDVVRVEVQGAVGSVTLTPADPEP